MRLPLSTEPPLEDLPGEAPAAEAEREGERQHEAAEGRGECDHDHVPADPEMGHGGSDREQEHAPSSGASQETGLDRKSVV